MGDRVIYSNRMNVTINEVECCIRFDWVAPLVDTKTNAIAEDVVDSFRVTMNKESAVMLADLIISTIKEQKDNNGEQEK